MLTFYRTRDCARCDDIEEKIEELHIAHDVVALKNEDADDEANLPPGARPPVLIDEHEVIEGADAILKHLESLEKFKADWYKFQSDACYCDENGEII